MVAKRMEMYPMFDTHRYIKLLEKQGFKEKQAESIVELVRDSRNYDLSKLATKEQLTEAKYDILKWVIGLNLAVIGLVIGILIKLYA